MAEEKKTKGKTPKGKTPKGDPKKAAGAKEPEEAKKEKPRRELKPKVPSEWEKRYTDECVPKLMQRFSFTNRMRVPRLRKIVINTSIKEALQDNKILLTAADELAAITGQRPVITRAKKSISNFKLRKGQSIGVMVTLRGPVMYEFMSRLVNVALPRVRDFKGVSNKAFDGKGNYTLGMTEQTIFPEINYDRVQRQYGMNVTFVTTARNNEEGKALLENMGMPFRGA